MSYINWTNVLNLARISSLEDEVKTAIEEWVESIGIDIELGRNFLSNEIATDSPEIHSINDDYVNSIILKNYPVIEITRLRDNINADNTSDIVTLEEHTNFEVELEKGIIHIVDAFGSTIMPMKTYFTKGINTVDVAYTYGYLSVPDDIIAFADLIAVRVSKIWNDVFGEKGVDFKMGDYEEKLSQYYKKNKSVFDDQLDIVKIKLMTKYGATV